MARHIAVLLSEAQARALLSIVREGVQYRQTEEDQDRHWAKTTGRVVERAVAAIERAARAEEIDL